MKPIAWVGIGLLSAAAIGGYAVYRPYERARQVVACEYELGSAQDRGVGCLMLRFGWSESDAQATTYERGKARMGAGAGPTANPLGGPPLRDSLVEVPPGYHKCWDAAGNPKACKNE